VPTIPVNLPVCVKQDSEGGILSGHFIPSVFPFWRISANSFEFELGKLTKISRNIEILIPTSENPEVYNSGLIWCKKFSVEIGDVNRSASAKSSFQDVGLRK